MSQSTPNLYDYSTKELAQDATLAYILAWADPCHRESNPELHRLGSALLAALLASYRDTKVPEVTSVRVRTQWRQIDILVKINNRKQDGVVLLIEDKVHTHEHSKQIERYIGTARQEYPDWKIVPVFVKTGNTSLHRLPDPQQCGRFLRAHLLRVLENYPQTRNTIVDNFREHLDRRERKTQAYRDMPPQGWDWIHVEGFYSDLEGELQQLDGRWDYVPNPKGGFLSFNFSMPAFSRDGHKFHIYPQIEGGTRLTVRLGSWSGGPKVAAPFMYDALRRLEDVAIKSTAFTVRKAGRFKGGNSGGLADIGFEEDGAYLARTPEGHVDLRATATRLEQVAAVLPQVADALSTAE